MAKLVYKGLKANLPATREADSFYLTTDTRELYFGENLYTEPIRFYTTIKPAAPAQGVLYIDDATGAGDVWNGSKWISVLKGYVTAIGSNADDSTVPTAKAAKEYIDNAIDSIDYAVTVTSDTEVEGIAKRYTITQTATGLSVNIDIPKDMVVESGVVEVKNESGAWGEAGTYLHLVLANANEDSIYINVANLIEYVTSGSEDGDMIVISVSADHKVTATITDGTITLDKLVQSVQDAIGKAHSHDNADVLDTITSEKVGAWDAAAESSHTHENADALAGITAEKITAWDEAVDAITVGTF